MVRAPFAVLRGALIDEPAIQVALASRNPVIAVPDAARALVLSAISDASERTPVLVATSSQAEAERLASDAATVLGSDAVALFPAWETLPFERVSPGVETMGRRLEVLHRLQSDNPPTMVVTSARALVQRLDPNAAIAPVVVGMVIFIGALRKGEGGRGHERLRRHRRHDVVPFFVVPTALAAR